MLSLVLALLLVATACVLASTWRELNNAYKHLIEQEHRYRDALKQSQDVYADLAKDAFNHLRSSSLEAKAAIDVAQSKAGLELELLKEAMRKQEPSSAPPEEAPGVIVTADGIRLEPVDILDLI